MGEISLQIYMLQKIIIEIIGVRVYENICEILGYNPLIQNISVYDYIITPIIALILAIFLAVLISIIRKNSRLSKILFGRL